MNDEVTPFLPLAPAALHILLSLAGEERHGYGIMQEVVRQSDGQYRLGPGTLYDNLQKLMTQGIVEETASRVRHDDPRRKYYRLSRFGRALLAAEVERLDSVIREARIHLRAHPRRAT